MFKPICIDNIHYIDGGITMNTPLSLCIRNENCNINEVFGIIESPISKLNLHTDSLLEYLFALLMTFIFANQTDVNEDIDISNNYIYQIPSGIDTRLHAVVATEYRNKLYKQGKKLYFNKYLEIEM